MVVSLKLPLLVVILQKKVKKQKQNRVYLKKEFYLKPITLNKFTEVFKGRSIGILFILLGLLFLLNNLNLIEVSLAELIRVYWPIILIWIGADKLLRKTTTQDKEE